LAVNILIGTYRVIYLMDFTKCFSVMLLFHSV